MDHKILQYQCDHTDYKVFLASDSAKKGKKPAVIVIHTWFGLNKFAEEQAEFIASLGYIGYAIDLYGNGQIAANEKEAADLMAPLYTNRQLLRKRLLAAHAALLQNPEVDPERIAVMGFCFGGLSAVELLKTGAPLKAVISVHGAFHGTEQTETAENIQASLLILTGAKDPIATMQDLEKLQEEMTKASVDWQTHIFASAGHSFTNKDAHNRDAGYYYDPLAAKRSYILIEQFLKEKFT